MCITLFNGLRFCSDCAKNQARGCGEKHGTILDWIFAPYHPNPLVIKSGNGKNTYKWGKIARFNYWKVSLSVYKGHLINHEFWRFNHPKNIGMDYLQPLRADHPG